MSKIRKRKTFSLRLSKFELLHLRDLFSVSLAPEAKQTVSQALAASEERSLVEARLWQTLVAVCREADLPMDDEAPDFVVAANSMPTVGVFRIAQEPNETSDEPEEGASSNIFGDHDVEEEDEG